MHVEQIEHFSDFLALEPDWTELCRRSHCDSFFLSHEWFRCCWVGQQSGMHPLVLVAFEGPRIVGIAPLLRQTLRWRGLPVRANSPFADLILPPHDAAAVLNAFLAHVERCRPWELLSLAKIATSSRAHRLLDQSLYGKPHIRTTAAVSPVLRLDGDWDGFWRLQSQRFKKTVRNVANRVERLGTIAVEDMSARGSAQDCLATFRTVADAAWKSGLPMSVTGNTGIARFFEALTTALHARGRLVLWVLRLDGAPIAAEYHVRDGDTVYALRSDFVDRYRDASPGAYLNYQIIRTYFCEELRAYDMGAGDNAYKQRWANERRQLDTFTVFGRSAYARALYRVERYAIPCVRQARRWWRRAATAGAGHVNGFHHDVAAS
jgi:CelD/BcsL family acetyltransferase involved in cellulose biosynthesis